MKNKMGSKSISVFLITVAIAVMIIAGNEPVPVNCMSIDNANVAAYYNMLPQSARAAFEASGWSVQVLPKSTLAAMYNIPAGYKIAGLTNHTKKIIIMNADSDASSNVIHEFGHWVDSRMGSKRSSTAEFQAIFQEESKNYTSYGQASASEFYAEVLMGLYVNNAAVTSKCPKAAAFVAADINSI